MDQKVKILNHRKKAEQKIDHLQKETEEIAEFNQAKVLNAFRKNNVSHFHFTPSTGYGYDDEGRDTLEKVYAEVFQAEKAIVRPQLISGTHAIATAFFGILRPQDELLYITGKPYDTLEEVIGIRKAGIGSLKDYDISYRHIPLKNKREVDFEAIKNQITAKTKMVAIQRSCGYTDRDSFCIHKIKEMIDFVKNINPNIIVFVDNCYGEFVETKEPTQVGADIIAGSLIKNPGGGLAKIGGYLVGKANLITLCGYRLTVPGIGLKAGASLYSLLEMYQGLFLAPHMTSQALKGARFTAAFLSELGIKTTPRFFEKRTDIIQSISFEDKDQMIAFAESIQSASPIDAYVKPVAAPLPGYEDEVIMAAGTFIQGASLELTADGPIRPPFRLYVQGGLTYEHVKIAITEAIENLINRGFLVMNESSD